MVPQVQSIGRLLGPFHSNIGLRFSVWASGFERYSNIWESGVSCVES